MSRFEDAIPVVMQHEGGWVDDPDDLGGETMMGWSTLTITKLGLKPRDLGIDQDEFTHGCLKLMKASTAEDLYRKHFWDRYGFAAIVDQTAATKCFDFAINAGPGNAATVAQRACGATIDGLWGPQTFARINATHDFVRAMATEMANYYESIIKARPKNEKFRSNWMRRAAWGVGK